MVRAIKAYAGVGLSLCVLVIAGLGLYHQQTIRDWLQLRNYQPGHRVVELADHTTMTDAGRKLFYVYHPSLLDKSAFNQNCHIDEQSIVLGCYVQHQGIYVFDVTDTRLAGIHEVTAAHEMLHAAYDRLSNSERARINVLLQETLSGIEDERIKQTIEAYRKRDPSVVNNELHSILGTEYDKLPPELEGYYKRYFSDRMAVVAYSKQYEGEFSSRKARITSISAELDSLRSRIDTGQSELSAQRSLLDAEKARMDSLLSASRIDEYNAAVPGFNQRVGNYNTNIARVQGLIDTFNAKVEEHNSLAAEQKDLIDAIDTRINTESAK